MTDQERKIIDSGTWKFDEISDPVFVIAEKGNECLVSFCPFEISSQNKLSENFLTALSKIQMNEETIAEYVAKRTYNRVGTHDNWETELDFGSGLTLTIGTKENDVWYWEKDKEWVKDIYFGDISERGLANIVDKKTDKDNPITIDSFIPIAQDILYDKSGEHAENWDAMMTVLEEEHKAKLKEENFLRNSPNPMATGFYQ